MPTDGLHACRPCLRRGGPGALSVHGGHARWEGRVSDQAREPNTSGIAKASEKAFVTVLLTDRPHAPQSDSHYARPYIHNSYYTKVTNMRACTGV